MSSATLSTGWVLLLRSLSRVDKYRASACQDESTYNHDKIIEMKKTKKSVLKIHHSVQVWKYVDYLNSTLNISVLDVLQNAVQSVQPDSHGHADAQHRTRRSGAHRAV